MFSCLIHIKYKYKFKNLVEDATELDLRFSRFILGCLVTATLSRLTFEIVLLAAFKLEIFSLSLFIAYVFVLGPFKLLFGFIFVIVEEPLTFSWQSTTEIIFFLYSRGCRWFMRPIYHGVALPLYENAVDLKSISISRVCIVWNEVTKFFISFSGYYHWIAYIMLVTFASGIL